MTIAPAKKILQFSVFAKALQPLFVADQELEYHVLSLEKDGATDATRPKAQQSGHTQSCHRIHSTAACSFAGN